MAAQEAGRAQASVWLLRAASLMLPFAWLTMPVAGKVFALLCVAGAIEWWRSRGSPPLDASLQAALRWLWGCAALSAVLVALSVMVHHDELRHLRQELRPLMLFLAIAAFSRLRRLDVTTARMIDAGLMLGLLATPAFVLMVGRERLPDNAVPWASTVAMGVCVVAARALLGTAPASWRVAGGLAAAAGLAAIVLSQTRAALWVLPWLALLVVTMPKRPRTRLLLAAGLLGALVAWGLWAQPFREGGRLRLAEAVHEFERFRSQGDAETSIGARLALWQLGAKGIVESPASALLGHGSSARQLAIRDLAARAASPHLASLKHFHNQYLNSLFDFGLAGLVAIMAMLVGAAGVFRHPFTEARIVRWQIGGLTWLQATGFMTNANWLHGHYVYMFSLAVALCVLPRSQMCPAQAPR